MKKCSLLSFLAFQEKILKKSCILLLFLGLNSVLYSQDWTNPLGGQNPNFYDIQKSFNDHWQGKDFNTTKGWKAYRRWEDFWQPRIHPDGSFPAPNFIATEWDNYRATHPNLVTQRPSTTETPEGLLTTTGAWVTLGPTTSNSGYSGIGRINGIAFHPTDANTFWVGTPAGGLWKTTNGGSTWATNSDNFPSLGVSAIAVHPTNPLIIYIGTGDGDGYDTYFYGMRKSIDGGTTWSTVALPGFTSVARRIIINPTTPSTIIASTSSGVYRSIDDGATWALTSIATNMYDIAFKPGNPNIVYAASSNQIFVSNDGGGTWTASTIVGSPAATPTTITNSRRIALAVSAADPTLVGVLSASSVNSGFNGYYTSTNSGTSFTLKTSAPNLLGWDQDGGDSGGQGGYDLCLAISPTNANTVYVGGVNTWKSADGGTTWAINTHWWATGTGYTAVHADKHFMAYQNSGTLFQCNDGGVYKTTTDGTSWTDLSNGLTISQMYRLGTAQTSAAVMTGLQDNSSKLMTPSVQWLDILSTGDGMEGAIDPVNDKIAYTESYYGSISRLALDANYQRSSSVNITPTIPGTTTRESGAWVTPFVIDPNNPAILYIGYNDIYKTPDRGATWTKISTNLSPNPTNGSNKILYIAVAPSNSNTIYASNQASTLFKTTDGGTTWATVVRPATSISNIAVSPTDLNTLFVTCSNTSAGQKVFKSTDGGATWLNISGTLPNVPTNCIIYEKNTNQGLYVGTDLGVFYRNAAMTDWIPFQAGLPNVIVRELDINYSTFKVIAATYGRGLWQSPLYFDGPATCNVPSTLTANSITAVGATLSWAGAQLATTYTVQYRPVTTPAAAWTDKVVSSNSTVLTGLLAATPYEWQVRSDCSAGPSAYSAPITFTTLVGGCAKVPTNLNWGTNTYLGNTTFSWGSQTDISQYKIEWKKPTDATWQVAYTSGTATNYSVGVLSPATIYVFRLSSVCLNEVASALTAETSFTTPAPSCSGAVSAPNLNLGSVYSNAAYLHWTQTYGKGYLFAYKKTSDVDWSYRTFSTNTSLQLDNLLPNTSYQCKVKSVCGGLNEVYSNVQTFTTKADACAELMIPFSTYSVTNITGTTATLNWGALAGVTSYKVEVIGFLPQTVTGTSYNMTGLTAGNWHYFRVSPICATGSPYLYPYTYGFKMTGTGCQAPPVFTTYAIPTPTTVKIFWGPVGGAASYTVQYKIAGTNNVFTNFTSTNTDYTFTGLSPNTSYEYRVIVTGNDCYYTNNTVTTTDDNTIGCAKVPTNLSINHNTYTGISTLFWGSQTDISQYKIEWKKTTDGTWQFGYAPSTSTNFGLGTLTPATSYLCRVSSICLNEVVSTPSAEFAFTTPAPTCSGAASTPSLVMNEVLSNAAYFSWTPTYGKGYLFAYKKTSETEWSYRTFSRNTSLQLDNLLPGTSYQCKVKSVCDGVNEVYSSVQTFTTQAEVCATQVVPLANYSVTNITGTSATLNWVALAGITTYRLEIFGFPIQNVTGTSYNITGLLANSGYSFKVSPICATGSPYLSHSSFPFRTTASVAGCQAPPILTSLATPTATTAKVFWGPVGGATSYTVQYKLAGTNNAMTSFTTANTNTNYTFTGLLPHTSYEYRISTTSDVSGCFASSNTVTTTDLPTAAYSLAPTVVKCNDAFVNIPIILDLPIQNINEGYTISLTYDVNQLTLVDGTKGAIVPADASLLKTVNAGSDIFGIAVISTNISGNIGDALLNLQFTMKPAAAVANTVIPLSVRIVEAKSGVERTFNITRSYTVGGSNAAKIMVYNNNVLLSDAVPTNLEWIGPSATQTTVLTAGQATLNNTGNTTFSINRSVNIPAGSPVIGGQDAFKAWNVLSNYALYLPTIDEIIAADANGSGTITIADVSAILKRGVGTITTFAQGAPVSANKDWRFYPKTLVTTPAFLISATYPACDAAGGYCSTRVPVITVTYPLSIPSNSCSVVTREWNSVLIGNVTGATGAFFRDPSVVASLRSTPPTVKLLLADSVRTAAGLLIPIFVSTTTTGLDLSFTSPAVIIEELSNDLLISSIGTSNPIIISSFTKDPAGIIAGTRYGYLKLQTTADRKLNASDFGTVAAYVNDIPESAIVQFTSSVLVVELTKFEARPIGKTVQLDWQTALEKDASHFEIERSSDGKTFTNIGQVKALGQSVILQNYAFTDEKPVNGVNYYRLRQVDVDRKETLSNTVSVTFQSETKLKTYPNPVSTILTIETDKVGDFYITNQLGQILIKGKIANRIDVSALPQGAYILKVGEEQARFIKQ